MRRREMGRGGARSEGEIERESGWLRESVREGERDKDAQRGRQRARARSRETLFPNKVSLSLSLSLSSLSLSLYLSSYWPAPHGTGREGQGQVQGLAEGGGTGSANQGKARAGRGEKRAARRDGAGLSLPLSQSLPLLPGTGLECQLTSFQTLWTWHPARGGESTPHIKTIKWARPLSPAAVRCRC